MKYSAFVDVEGNLASQLRFLSQAVSDDGARPMLNYIHIEPSDKGGDLLRNVRRDGELGTVEEIGEEHRGGTAHGSGQWWAVEPDVGRVAHGIPSRVDRLKGCGNAIVPQCVEMIFSLPAFDRWRVTA